MRIAGELLARIGGGAAASEIAELFSADANFEIAGDIGALPWIGQKTGRTAVAGFVRDLRELTEPVGFKVQGYPGRALRARCGRPLGCK